MIVKLEHNSKGEPTVVQIITPSEQFDDSESARNDIAYGLFTRHNNGAGIISEEGRIHQWNIKPIWRYV